jgi:hypothetical protein
MPPSWACAAAAGGAIGVGILKMPVELTSRLKMEEIGDNVPVLLERMEIEVQGRMAQSEA